jgi:hypothetical protein
MYAFPNATISCGGPVPGGEPCPHCPDEMPPTFVVSGDFGNGDCTECEDVFNGLFLPQLDPCYYDGSPGSLCEGVYAPYISIEFLEDRIDVIFSGMAVDVVYRRGRNVGDNCNQANTIPLVSSTGDDCDWPDEITITPSA